MAEEQEIQIDMKKLLCAMALLVCSMVMYAQNDVTKFLGIPVDGSKKDMIQKLEAKGFQYNRTLDCLVGEFNGQDVALRVVTNNNKVWRIMVIDVNDTNEENIRIRFNTLLNQFVGNSKYIAADYNTSIPDDEDISYEMQVHSKRYEANFCQLSTGGNATDDYSKRHVWFIIVSPTFGQYCIALYYDNICNQANGEDL